MTKLALYVGGAVLAAILAGMLAGCQARPVPKPRAATGPAYVIKDAMKDSQGFIIVKWDRPDWPYWGLTTVKDRPGWEADAHKAIRAQLATEAAARAAHKAARERILTAPVPK